MGKEVSVDRKEISKLSPEELVVIETTALSIPLETGTFEINGIKFFLGMTESVNQETGKPNGNPAEYHHPSDSWDIYLWDDMPKNVTRIMLYHELIEIGYRLLGYGAEAHGLALEHENNFLKHFGAEEAAAVKKIREQYPEV